MHDDMSWEKLTVAICKKLQLATLSRSSVWSYTRGTPIPEDILAAILEILDWGETVEDIKRNYEITIKPAVTNVHSGQKHSRLLATFDSLAAQPCRRDETHNLTSLFAQMDHRDFFCLITLTTTPLEHRYNRLTQLSVATANAIKRGARVVYFFPTERLSDHLRETERYLDATRHEDLIDDFNRFRTFVFEHLTHNCGMSKHQAEWYVYHFLGYHLYDDAIHIASALQTIGVFGTADTETAKNARVTIRTQDDQNEEGFILGYPRNYLLQSRMGTLCAQQL